MLDTALPKVAANEPSTLPRLEAPTDAPSTPAGAANGLGDGPQRSGDAAAVATTPELAPPATQPADPFAPESGRELHALSRLQKLKDALTADVRRDGDDSDRSDQHSPLRLRVDALLRKAEELLGLGQLPEARRTAQLAQDLSDTAGLEFTPTEDRPVDLLRRIDDALETASEAPPATLDETSPIEVGDRLPTQEAAARLTATTPQLSPQLELQPLPETGLRDAPSHEEEAVRLVANRGAKAGAVPPRHLADSSSEHESSAPQPERGDPPSVPGGASASEWKEPAQPGSSLRQLTQALATDSTSPADWSPGPMLAPPVEPSSPSTDVDVAVGTAPTLQDDDSTSTVEPAETPVVETDEWSDWWPLLSLAALLALTGLGLAVRKWVWEAVPSPPQIVK